MGRRKRLVSKDHTKLRGRLCWNNKWEQELSSAAALRSSSSLLSTLDTNLQVIWYHPASPGIIWHLMMLSILPRFQEVLRHVGRVAWIAELPAH
jgi:hypothetical protein